MAIEAIIIPELLIYKTLKSIFQIVKEDFDSNPLKDTMLYNLFGLDGNGDRLSFENFDYLQQSIEVFINKTPEVNLGYNMEVASMGCVHILLPSENGSALGIGADENYQPYDTNSEQDEFREVFTQKYDSTYNLLISSENSFEVILIYNLLKSSLLALNYHLELSGLRLPKISGQDVNLDSSKMPSHIFHRSVMLNFNYELNVPNFFYKKLVKLFQVSGKPENQ